MENNKQITHLSDEKLWNNFCRNVAWLRKRYRLSKEKMASFLQIGTRTLTQIEQGVIPPQLNGTIIIRIWKIFEKNPCQLFGTVFEEIE